MKTPPLHKTPPQTPTARWEDLLDRLTLRVLSMARGITRPDESVWTSFSKRSSSRYVMVRLGMRGSPGNTFTIRVSDHPLDPLKHKRDFQFEIILAPPSAEEPLSPLEETDVEFFLKSSQTRSAVRASRRQLSRWLEKTRDRVNGRLPPQGRNCKKRG